MAYIEGHARDQALLLPASVEDYVAADSPVRFIDAFVDDLDPGEAGFCRSRPKATGRPGYNPGDMVGDATKPLQEKIDGLKRSLETHMKTQTWVISIIGFTIVTPTEIGTLVSILRH